MIVAHLMSVNGREQLTCRQKKITLWQNRSNSIQWQYMFKKINNLKFVWQRNYKIKLTEQNKNPHQSFDLLSIIGSLLLQPAFPLDWFTCKEDILEQTKTWQASISPRQEALLLGARHPRASLNDLIPVTGAVIACLKTCITCSDLEIYNLLFS